MLGRLQVGCAYTSGSRRILPRVGQACKRRNPFYAEKRSRIKASCAGCASRRAPHAPLNQLEKTKMNAIKMLGIALIVAGGLGLLYGGFTYTQDTHEAKLGPIELSVKDKKTVNIPIWAGVGAIAVGAFLLFARNK
jgi:hypothetical protein